MASLIVNSFHYHFLLHVQLMMSSYSRAVISLVMFLIQFLIPLMITMLAYAHISYHLWGSEHIGAATQQQQLRRLASRRRTIKGR